MKSLKRIIALSVFVFAFMALSAQFPPPPNGGGNPTSNGSTPVGGGAPIGSGIVLLISLAAGYGGKKVFDARKKLVE